MAYITVNGNKIREQLPSIQIPIWRLAIKRIKISRLISERLVYFPNLSRKISTACMLPIRLFTFYGSV